MVIIARFALGAPGQLARTRVGAVVVKEPYQMDGMPGWIATLADPDGNYFQLMSPMGPG